nr:MAG TPA: hypothetical protein [Caudoviricetes sp.]
MKVYVIDMYICKVLHQCNPKGVTSKLHQGVTSMYGFRTSMYGFYSHLY